MTEPICLVSRCGQIRARFEMREDRFHHFVEIKQADGFETRLTSIEGNSATEWPPSPPLQEVRDCDMGDDQVCLLGTGMAGRTYWSLSVTQCDRGILFDHACRPSSGVTAVAHSQYKISQLKMAEPMATEPTTLLPDGSIQLAQAPSQFWVSAENTESGDRPTIELAAGNLKILPVSAQQPPGPTIRWAYRFEAPESSGSASQT